MAFTEVWRATGKPRLAQSAWLPAGHAYADIVLSDFFAPAPPPEDPPSEGGTYRRFNKVARVVMLRRRSDSTSRRR